MVKEKENGSWARQELARRVHESPFSIRALASRVDLKGHGALSRYLRGKGSLSLPTILKLARELGIEGRVLDRLKASLIPEWGERPEPVRKKRPVSVANEQQRVADKRFFANPRAPMIYELMKILGKATVSRIASCLHPALGFNHESILDGLRGLQNLSLISGAGDTWWVTDSRKDFVMPTKNTVKFARDIVQDSINFQSRYLHLSSPVRLMRSVLTTVPSRTDGSPLLPLVPLVTRFQDDLLELQEPRNETVVSVYVGCVVAGGTGLWNSALS